MIVTCRRRGRVVRVRGRVSGRVGVIVFGRFATARLVPGVGGGGSLSMLMASRPRRRVVVHAGGRPVEMGGGADVDVI